MLGIYPFLLQIFIKIMAKFLVFIRAVKTIFSMHMSDKNRAMPPALNRDMYCMFISHQKLFQRDLGAMLEQEGALVKMA